MGTEVVATLSTTGWLQGTFEKADKLMGYFLLSDASQSTEYKGEVASLPWLIKTYGINTNESQLITEVTATLQRLYGRHYDNVSVEARVEYPNDRLDNRANLIVSIVIQENGQSYPINKAFEVLDGIARDITDQLNNGI